jgi:hypothetical protein
MRASSEVRRTGYATTGSWRELPALCDESGLHMPDSATQKEIAGQLQELERAVDYIASRLAIARNFRVNTANEGIGVADVQ